MAGPNKKTTEEADSPALAGAANEYIRIAIAGSNYKLTSTQLRTFVLGNGLGNAQTLTLGAGVTGAAYSIAAKTDRDGLSIIQIENASSGTAAQAEFSAYNGTSFVGLLMNGASFTTAGVVRQAGAILQTNGAGGLTLNTSANQPVYFGVNNTEVAKFDTTPALDLVCGKLKFPASQSASADANTLDDYEEGTWTPVFTASGISGVTYGTQSGYYTKVGRIVHLEMRVTLTSKGSGGSGVASFSGLPFTVADRSGVLAAIYDLINLNAGYTSAQGSANAALTTITMVELGDNVAGAGITWANYANTTDVQCTGHYHV